MYTLMYECLFVMLCYWSFALELFYSISENGGCKIRDRTHCVYEC